MTQVDASHVFRHFKGGRYRVLCFAKHSEDGRLQVVYVSLDNDVRPWVRPLAMWDEPTDRWPDGVERSRFALEAKLPATVLEHFDKAPQKSIFEHEP